MVSAFSYGFRGFGSRHCVVFLGKKLYSYSSLFTQVFENEFRSSDFNATEQTRNGFASHPGGKVGGGGGWGRGVEILLVTVTLSYRNRDARGPRAGMSLELARIQTFCYCMKYKLQF